MNAVEDNPYVGLRPFESDDSLFFFGRKEQVIQLLERLNAHHFLAVVGSSGSGKSSLIKAGLIPNLEGGVLIEKRDKWKIGQTTPGQSPIANLATAIHDSIDLANSSIGIDQIKKDILERGEDAVLDYLGPLLSQGDTNYFLLIDQFEELFRFAPARDRIHDVNKDFSKDYEAIDFVNILLALAEQTELPIYVTITMRSDFIGDCAKFYGLPEALNKAQYLVPRLKRSERKTAIESPARLMGKKIHPGLTSKLLNDLESEKDELPLLQHALMRIWDTKEFSSEHETITLEDYENIQGKTSALAEHAEKVFKLLHKSDQLLATKIFQALTAIDQNGRKIRRPCPLSELRRITGETNKKLLEIIDQFIDENRSFLVKKENEDAKGDLLVDISHESLIRQWDDLRKWVDEEGKIAESYLKLVEAARDHGNKKRGLYDNLEVKMLTIDIPEFDQWLENPRPYRAWARRYDKGFNSAINFLKKSKQKNEDDRIAEEKRIKEEEQRIENERLEKKKREEEERRRDRAKLTRARILLVLSAIVVVAVFYLRYMALEARDSAENATAVAEKLRQDAENSERTAKRESYRASVAQIRAEGAEAKAKSEQQKAEEALKTAEEATIIAKKDRSLALLATENALAAEFSADSARCFAIDAKNESDTLKSAFRLTSLAIKAEAEDPTYALRVAELAYNQEGDALIDDIRQKIFKRNTFYKTLIGKDDPGAEYGIRSLDISPTGDIITNGSDNVIRLWKKKDGKYEESPAFSNNNDKISSVSFSAEGSKILTGGYDSFLRLWDLNGKELKRWKINAKSDTIQSVWFHPNPNLSDTIVYTETPDSTCTWSIAQNPYRIDSLVIENVTYHSTLLVEDSTSLTTVRTPKSIRNPVRNDGSFRDNLSIILPLTKRNRWEADNKVILSQGIYLNLQSRRDLEVFKPHKNQKILSIAISPSGRLILTGSADHTARLWDLRGNLIQQFIGHKDSVTHVQFHPDQKKIITGSLDGTVKEWPLDLVEIPHGGVYSLAFSPNSTNILTTSSNERLWRLNGQFQGETPFEAKWRSQVKRIVAVENKSTYLNHDTVTCIAFSPDSSKMVAGYDDTALLRDRTTNDVLHEFRHNQKVSSVAFSPDGSKILTGCYDKTAILWDIKSGEAVQEFKKHNALVSSVAFSYDGTKILTGSYDRTAILWDSKTAQVLQEFEGHDDFVMTVAFSPNDKFVLTGSSDETARLWRIRPLMEQFLEGANADTLTFEQKQELLKDGSENLHSGPGN